MYVLLEMTQKHNPCNTDNWNVQACSNSAEQITLWIFKVTKWHCQANNVQSFQDVLFVSFSLHQRENLLESFVKNANNCSPILLRALSTTSSGGNTLNFLGYTVTITEPSNGMIKSSCTIVRCVIRPQYA